MRLTGIYLHNPVLGIELVTTEVDEEGGTRLVVDYEIEPRRPRDEFRHVHRTWTEQFEIHAGDARYEVGGQERAARAGDVVQLPANMPHLHPWNVGDGILHMRQIATLDPPDAEALRHVGYGIATLYGTVAEGRHDARGRPPLLQVASTLRSFQRYGIFLASPAVPVQRVI
ncbi:MAG TPA: cupin domain-containing protein, partial [Longimicrobiales bacterium]